MDPLQIVRDRMRALLTERATHEERRNGILAAAQQRGEAATDATARVEASNLTADEDRDFRAASDRITAIDTEYDELEARERDLVAVEERDQRAAASRQRLEQIPAGETRGVGGARVEREARTYTRDTSRAGTSFFSDHYRSLFLGDRGATERIARHAQEVTVEREQRASSTGSYAGLIPPQYLTDQAALIARAGRPFANVVQHLPLPPVGTAFRIPRETTGATVSSQATENSAVSSTDEVFTDLVVNQVTIAGQEDISRQSIERGEAGIDQLIFRSLLGAYFAELDRQTLAGTGASGQMLGALNTAGINQATAFAAAATPQALYTKLAGQLSAVEENRLLAPTVIVMRPRRWNWLLGQVDASNRPLVVPNMNGPMNGMGVASEPVDTPSAQAVGWMLGLPVITDANMPGAVGSGPEDQILVARADDLLLWEDGDGTPQELRFDQTLAGQLTVKLVLYGYAAFTAGRYPAAVGVVGGNSAAGNGLVAPSF